MTAIAVSKSESTAGSRRSAVPYLGLRAIEYSWLTVVFLIAWEVIPRLSSSIYFPPLSTIVSEGAGIWFSTDPSRWFVTDTFISEVLPSLRRFAQGWFLSIVVGVVVGVIIGLNPTLRALTNPLIRFGISIPATTLLPVAILFFGVEDSMSVALIFLGTVWTVLINAMDGAMNIDTMYIRVARSMRLSRWRSFKMQLSAASPGIIAGVRVSLGIGLLLMVVSELFVSTHGLGAYIILASNQYRFVEMWSGVLLVAILGILLNALFALAESWLLRWRRGFDG